MSEPTQAAVPPAAPPAAAGAPRRRETTQAASPAGDHIDIDDFAKIELRAALVARRGEDRRLEEAPEAPGRPRRREAADRLRHRRRLRARVAGRQEDRARREPEAGEADGRRVERHGARRLGRRQGRALHVRRRRRPGHEGEVATRDEGAPCARRPGWPWPPLPPSALSDVRGRPRASSTTWPRACPRRALVVAGRAALRHARRRAAAGGRLLPRGRARGGDPFLWSQGRGRGGARLARAAPRFAVVDLAPYQRREGPVGGGAAQRTRPSRASPSTTRATATAFALPAEAQRAGDNRLRFVFAATASPAERAGQRRPAAARGRVLQPRRRRRRRCPASRTCSAATRRGRSRSRRRTACPSLVAGRARAWCATRIRAAAVGRAALHARRCTPARAPPAPPRPSASREEAKPGEERELWSAVLGPAVARAGRGRGSGCRGEGGRHRAHRPARGTGRGHRRALRLGPVERAARARLAGPDDRPHAPSPSDERAARVRWPARRPRRPRTSSS